MSLRIRRKLGVLCVKDESNAENAKIYAEFAEIIFFFVIIF